MQYLLFMILRIGNVGLRFYDLGLMVHAYEMLFAYAQHRLKCKPFVGISSQDGWQESEEGEGSCHA